MGHKASLKVEIRVVDLKEDHKDKVGTKVDLKVETKEETKAANLFSKNLLIDKMDRMKTKKTL